MAEDEMVGWHHQLTEKPGVLQFVGLQKAGQYLAAEQPPPPSPVLVSGQLLG